MVEKWKLQMRCVITEHITGRQQFNWGLAPLPKLTT